MNALGGAWQQADRALGGWLPGGGTPSPVTRAVQNPTQAVRSVREDIVVPALDRGMEAGFIPPTPGMYARFLTGTTQPLTRVPKGIKEGEAQFVEAAVNYRNSKEKEVARRSKQLEDAESLARQVQQLQNGFALGGMPSGEVQTRFTRLMEASQQANKNAGLSDSAGPEKIRSQLESLRREPREERMDPRNYSKSGYSGWTGGWRAPNHIDMSLGSYEVKDGTIKDRYDFAYYTPQNTKLYRQDDMTTLRGAVDVLRAGNPRGLIPLAHQLGLIRPGQGYDVRLKIR